MLILVMVYRVGKACSFSFYFMFTCSAFFSLKSLNENSIKFGTPESKLEFVRKICIKTILVKLI